LLEKFQSIFDFEFSTNPATPAQKISIAITIAFENLSLINRTLIFIFQSRSLLRPINHKKSHGNPPASDVKPLRVLQSDPG